MYVFDRALGSIADQAFLAQRESNKERGLGFKVWNPDVVLRPDLRWGLTCVSLNSRLESNKEEEKLAPKRAQTCAMVHGLAVRSIKHRKLGFRVPI